MLEFVILMTGNHSSCRITKEMFHDSLSRNPIFHNGSEKCQKFKGVFGENVFAKNQMELYHNRENE